MIAEETINNKANKRRFPRLNWPLITGLVLIAAGLVLANFFIRPYVYLVISAVPMESGHPLSRPDHRIFIPGIKLESPLFTDPNRDEDGIIFRFYRFPGRDGNVVLEGHNFDKYGPQFSLLYLVKPGDEVVLHYEGRRYVYRVRKKKVVEPRQLSKVTRETKDNRLTLITCYPPTSTAMRLVVTAKPEPAEPGRW